MVFIWHEMMKQLVWTLESLKIKKKKKKREGVVGGVAKNIGYAHHRDFVFIIRSCGPARSTLIQLF